MEQKIAVITGVSRGLGRAMAEGFIKQGWIVAGCCRSEEAAKELSRQYPQPHLFQSADVSDMAAISAFGDVVLEQLGTPDLLINNAAIINKNAPLWEIEPADFSRLIDINIKGVYHTIRHFMPAMLQRSRGVIVNFSSGWGRSTSPDVASYCASKFAIEGMSQALSQETDNNVAVVALNPGIIDTEMLRSTFGTAAGSYDDAKTWAKTAVPFLINLGMKDNGKALTAP